MTRPFFAVIAKALLILCVALIGAVVGAAIIFFAVVILGELTGSDNEQGAIAMGAAGFIPFGAIVGGVLGTWLIGRNIRLVSSKTAMVVGFGLPSLAAALVGGWINCLITDTYTAERLLESGAGDGADVVPEQAIPTGAEVA